MLGDRTFWFGVVAGLGGLWLYHHFVGAVPGGKKAS
jgi:hypothetical protein